MSSVKKKVLSLAVRTFIIFEVAPDLVAHIVYSCPLAMRPAKDLVRRRHSDTSSSVLVGALKHKFEKQTQVEREPGSDSE